MTKQQPAYLTNIRPDLVENHSNTFGKPALWEKSYLCPCRDKRTRQPRQYCEVCNGRGIAYLPPKDLVITLQSQEKSVFNGDLGILDSGTAIGTPKMDFRVAFRDRITIPQIKVSQSFIFDVTERRTSKGFFMVYDVHTIEYAVTMDGVIHEGEDYDWDREKNIIFPKEHLIGKNVSINISTTLRYMVADLLKEHRYALQPDGSYQSLPQKLLLKREDIFVDKEAFENEVEEEDIGQMIETKRQPTRDGINGFFRQSGN